MFLYITSERFILKTKIRPLSENPNWIKQAATWLEGKWGHIRKLGVEKRSELLQAMINDIYILTYAGQPIGMFGLKNHETPDTKELLYVYIDESFRGLGLFSQLIKAAKEIAEKQEAKMIVLDTLTPYLNKMYEKNGATVVGEFQLFGFPTDRLSIDLR